jgi:hypothetical protein
MTVTGQTGSGDPQPVITVLYSCTQCSLRKVPCDVPVRGEEDVVKWVREVMAKAISEHHRKQSPWCTADKITDVMIPVSGAERIGDAPQS